MNDIIEKFILESQVKVENRYQRRQYATAALTGILANPNTSAETEEDGIRMLEFVAKYSFKVADAMIKAENDV